jgi:pyruvate dehydrogenase E2 component (dihydrolipoamide acetyltransferase)
MAAEITMPRLSDSMEEGTIIKWLVSEGDEIQRGQEIAEIETDKANMTFESDAAGTVLELVASEGDTLQIGEVIARVGEAGEVTGDGGRVTEEPAEEEPAPGDGDGAAAPADSRQPTADTPSSNGADGGERVKASPVARRMARDMGVELAGIEGSGPGGRIVKADVEAAAEGGGTVTKEKPADSRQPTADEEEERAPEPAAADAGP